MHTIIRGGIIATCDQSHRVVTGDVAITDGRITHVGKVPSSVRPARVIDARGCAVLPGFVQAHVHLCQVLFRGMADDLPLLAWLKERIWPFEAAHNETSLGASAELGLLEMMRAGTTTILDMGTVRNHDAVMQACADSGIRAISGKTMMDAGASVPKGLRESTQESLRESDRLLAAWHGKGLLQYAYAPRFILSCTEALVRAVAERSKAHDVIMHSHAAEHPGERDAVRELFGDDDVLVLRRWGLRGKRAVLAHGVQLTDAQARVVAKDGTRFVHCPSANLKLGSGIARVAELRALGVLFALGADGAPCNNNLDPWMELRHAALLAKHKDTPEALPAREALAMGTIDGARALGLDAVTGSVEVGKRADLQVVRIDGPHVEPGGDVLSRLVYACTSRDVEHVFVDGAHVVRNGEHTRLDHDSVLRRARTEAPKLRSRAKV